MCEHRLNNMKTLVTVVFSVWAQSLADDVPFDNTTNLTDSNKDMYVIHAMMYQVGIMTNKSDEDMANSNLTGNQEAITFYHNNGSGIDLSKIPSPILTNVTAQRLVGVAPLCENYSDVAQILPWNTASSRTARNTQPIMNYYESILNNSQSPSSNSVPSKENTVKIVKGTSVIPEEVKVQSVAIPPLLTLNNNLSKIPVPIPNTSVVQYAKINTLLKTP